MMVNDRKPEVTTDELRGGATPGIARYVLGISLVAIVVIFGALLILYR